KSRLEKDLSYSNDIRMRCTNSQCRKSETVFSGLKFKIPRIDFCEYIFIVYSWLEKNFEYNINKNSNVSLSTIKRIKRQIIQVISKETDNYSQKLGKNYPVQIDESIIVKGKLINSPSNKYDSIKNSTWIIGAVEEITRNIVLEIVPNRKKETFLKFFQTHIEKRATIKTDGHKSYPYAVAGIEGNHIIVNHELGFKNSEGYHTNLIECEWSQIKADIKTRRGVPNTKMQ
ncbi:hypothetical protein DMUE_6309, partial [Dictyocoela muelleri]